jgi:hypothetical protein
MAPARTTANCLDMDLSTKTAVSAKVPGLPIRVLIRFLLISVCRANRRVPFAPRRKSPVVGSIVYGAVGAPFRIAVATTFVAGLAAGA